MFIRVSIHPGKFREHSGIFLIFISNIRLTSTGLFEFDMNFWLVSRDKIFEIYSRQLLRDSW